MPEWMMRVLSEVFDPAPYGGIREGPMRWAR